MATIINGSDNFNTNDVITNAEFDSKLLTGLNASGSAPLYACRAWVNFNGTGTVAVRESGNVSSVTDLGVGYWRVNLSSALQTSNPAAIVGDYYGTSNPNSKESVPAIVATSTTQIHIKHRYVWTNNGNTLNDATSVYLVVHG